MPKEITQLELNQLRRTQYEKQRGKCAILNISIPYEDCVLDHKHKKKSEEAGENGLGCLRGVIHRNVNSFEGKLERLWKRYGLQNIIELPELLRRCADYIECPPMKPEFIHPNERKKKERLTQTQMNKIRKYWFVLFPRKKKLPKAKPFILNDHWERILNVAEEFSKKSKLSNEEKANIKRAMDMIREEKKKDQK